MSATHFERVHHLVVVLVAVAATGLVRFVLDTGIGLTLLSQSLCDAIGCSRPERRSRPAHVRPGGHGAARRRTDALDGQRHKAPRRRRAGHERDLAGAADIDGFLSLAFFAKIPFTVARNA